MTSKELNLLLIKTFPNLNNAYEQEVSWQEGNRTGSHTVYGDVLTPYVISCIENNNQKEIKKIFTYIDFLLSKKDSYIEEVITFSVLESIEYLLNQNRGFLSVMGKETKRVVKEQEQAK
ncbi:DUF7674 family protein [Candidatus Enterococcus murrayae]|uniref:DUF7674 domain-containing protein n=1 Tax=Candidatus Enterococcus murrayae TaxID=2815321 RepID=A0ABS3HI88_9ENTE|nr:hypothetical protein [Enterococcus sp. MJM16]MBO0453176.1 hypothetical protein [Enterococcus sp. MJM16]